MFGPIYDGTDGCVADYRCSAVVVLLYGPIFSKTTVVFCFATQPCVAQHGP